MGNLGNGNRGDTVERHSNTKKYFKTNIYACGLSF